MATYTVTIPCSGCDETDFHLSSTTFSENFTSNSYKYDNLKTVASSTTYARILIDSTASVMSYVFLEFDFSSIPSNATITRIDGKVRAYTSGTSTYCSSRQIRWCIGNGETWMNYSQALSTQSNPSAIEIDDLRSNITWEQLQNVKCRVQYTRTSRASNSKYYIYVYGADVTVTYEIEEGGLFIKQNDEFVKVNKIYKKVNNSWVEQTDYSNLFDNNHIYVHP